MTTEIFGKWRSSYYLNNEGGTYPPFEDKKKGVDFLPGVSTSERNKSLSLHHRLLDTDPLFNL